MTSTSVILHSFDSNVGRKLSERVEIVFRNRAQSLIQGGAKRDSSEMTAASYMEDVGYARALLDCVDWIKDIEDELTGRAANREKVKRGRPE